MGEGATAEDGVVLVEVAEVAEVEVADAGG